MCQGIVRRPGNPAVYPAGGVRSRPAHYSATYLSGTHKLKISELKKIVKIHSEQIYFGVKATEIFKNHITYF